MMSDIIKKKLKYFNVICTSVLILILSACNSDNKGSFYIKNHFLSSESRLFNSYSRYINEISTPDFQLLSFQSDEELLTKSTFIQKFKNDNNMHFFPATLWQVYALNGKSEWKDRSEEYSRLLLKVNKTSNLSNNEVIQGVFMNSFLITGNHQYKAMLLKMLSQNIAKEEESGDFDCSAGVYNDTCIEKLLYNQLLFFSSKETGDPVFRNIAISYSENIYNLYFNSNQSDEVYYGLAYWDILPDLGEIKDLSTQDFYELALCFYGFTLLDNEIEIIKYHKLSERLAEIFTAIFEDIEGENKSNLKNKELITGKVDLMSQALVCLSFQNLKSSLENQYKEMAEIIFESILDDMEKPDISNHHQYTFRMYYYLFEYLKFV